MKFAVFVFFVISLSILSLVVNAQIPLPPIEEEIVPEPIVPVTVKEDITTDPVTGQQVVVTRLETCKDGIKNQDETDVDCGGVCGSCALNPLIYAVIGGGILVILIIVFLLMRKKNTAVQAGVAK